MPRSPGLPGEALDSLGHVLDLAYRSLARRERTEAEVRRHLEGRKVEPGLIDEALAVLRDHGSVDDPGYARRFAEDRRSLDGWGPDRIEQRLLAAGVAPEYVLAALDARTLDEELEAALALLRRRFPDPPRDDRDRSRALGLLVRRGYDLELARDAIRAYGREGV